MTGSKNTSAVNVLWTDLHKIFTVHHAWQKHSNTFQFEVYDADLKKLAIIVERDNFRGKGDARSLGLEFGTIDGASARGGDIAEVLVTLQALTTKRCSYESPTSAVHSDSSSQGLTEDQNKGQANLVDIFVLLKT